ncbi:hypothetical protein VTL71DRAFT_8647 [Oculimacula yallundae]|uniref:Uncharacterized protein n=1 Tax=Oculimacula yallundae TaxID=86028 RepID=A0ABR4CY73_9HELO
MVYESQLPLLYGMVYEKGGKELVDNVTEGIKKARAELVLDEDFTDFPDLIEHQAEWEVWYHYFSGQGARVPVAKREDAPVIKGLPWEIKAEVAIQDQEQSRILRSIEVQQNAEHLSTSLKRPMKRYNRVISNQKKLLNLVERLPESDPKYRELLRDWQFEVDSCATAYKEIQAIVTDTSRGFRFLIRMEVVNGDRYYVIFGTAKEMKKDPGREEYGNVYAADLFEPQGWSERFVHVSAGGQMGPMDAAVGTKERLHSEGQRIFNKRQMTYKAGHGDKTLLDFSSEYSTIGRVPAEDK